MKLTSRELATVLAALRWWQQELQRLDPPNDIPPIGFHFTDQTPLSGAEIDDLCERLNVA